MKRLTAALGLVALLFWAAPAQATTIQITLQDVTAAGGGNWNWNYEAVLTDESRLDGPGGNPSTIVIYDFRGFTGFESSPANWNFQSPPPLVGPYPFAQMPADSGMIENMVWRYTGPLVTNLTDSPISLGIFTVQSMFSETNFVNGFYSTEDTRRTSVDPDIWTQGGHTAQLPVPGAVPEPATMLLLGLGLLALGTRVRRS
jgi:hypothetical protein